jgi:malate synthase
LAEELMVIQEARRTPLQLADVLTMPLLMEQITTSEELIDFLTLPGYRLLA